MSSIGTLTSVPHMGIVKVILSVVALAGLTIDIPADYKHFEDNLKPEFKAKFPHGKIPAFESADGFLLYEGYPIARYISALAPNAGLLGTDLKEAALVDQWSHLAETEINTPLGWVWGICNNKLPYSKPLHTTLLEGAVRALTTINNHLATRTYVIGERITLADLVVAAASRLFATNHLDVADRPKYIHIIRHTETINHHPQLKEIWGDFVLSEKPMAFVPPPKEKKEAKPAAAAVPKAEKKPKAKEVDEDEEDDLVPAEPKVKNPLDDLPKSTFNLEDWKRAYSNKDTRGPGGAIEWFYENFDHEGFSIWRVDFKYNEELTLTFMSGNQIGGFFNRLEGSRKYLFGSMGVLGTANDSIISGTFILRGQDAKLVAEAAPDWESYEYKKLDVKDEADKAFFEAALAWDLEIDGKKWIDGKNFK